MPVGVRSDLVYRSNAIGDATDSRKQWIEEISFPTDSRKPQIGEIRLGFLGLRSSIENPVTSILFVQESSAIVSVRAAGREG